MDEGFIGHEWIVLLTSSKSVSGEESSDGPEG